MSKVRTTYWGATPVFSVDYEDGRELREATFFDRREAEAFAAEQAPAGRPVASRAAVLRANRAFFDRMENNDPPEPRTLQGVLRRIRDTIQTQTARFR